MLTLRSFALQTQIALCAFSLTFCLLLAGLPSVAQTPASAAVPALRPQAQANRIAAGASLAPQLQLTGHIPAWVTPAHQTRAALDLSTLLHISIVLRRDPSVEAALDQLLADQQNPASPLYHQWLTPEQLGTLYGPTQSDLDAITSWASSQGLTLASIQPNRVIVELNGSLATVSTAFHTNFAYFTFGTDTRLSATTEPSIPAAFGVVIQSIHGLTETHLQPQSRFSIHSLPVDNASPKITLTSGSHYLMANDFSAIYDLSSVYSGGNTGATIGSTTQRIAIVGESRVASADISNYESLAGLSSYQPNVVIPANGTDPGTSNADAAAEATLDIDRVIGTARGAAVDLVVSGTSQGEDGLDIAITYNINTLRDPIMTISFGGCEAQNGQSTASFYNTEFQTAASGGMSVFVSSGDSGGAGCDTSFTNAPSSQTLSVNVLCSSSYVTCVGGTEFNDVASPSTYWSTSNGTGDESAIGYIPEGAWNEPNNYMTGNGYWIAATGGGTSVYIARPSWQSGSAFPAGSYRLTPDVAFSAADHDGYFGCFAASNATCIVSGGQIPFTVFSGTSAAAPSMAGIAALINTQLGSKQGNMNPLLYGIDVSSPTAFHDATVATSGVTSCATATPSMCNNSTPGPSTLTGGLAGYALLTGYDEATGLGSLDVAKFLTAAVSSTVATSLAVTASPSPALVNQAVTLTATLTPGTSSQTPTGTVQFYSNSVAIGSPVTVANNVATLSYTFTTAGVDSIYAVYSADANFSTSTAPTLSLVINTPGFTITPATTSYSLISGATTNPDAIIITSVNNFAATLQLSCAVTTASGNAAGSCTILPNAATLTAGSTATSTLTIATTTGTSGILNVKVSGASGSTTVSSAAITVNLTASAFTLTPSPAALPVSGNLISGNTVTSTVTVASTNNFVGNVALTCSAANLRGSGTAAGSCSVFPTSVTLTSGGTATAALTIVTTAGTSGVLTTTVTGNGTTANSSIATTASTTVTVTTVIPGFTLTPATASLALISGATTGNTTPITVTSTNGFAGTVTLTCTAKNTSGTAAGACAATPVTLTAGSSATSTVSLTSTPGTSGVLTLSLAATFGTISATAPTPVITATLTAASFMLAASPASLSFTSGATSGNTDTVTLTSVGFVGSVSMSCTVSASSATYQPNCSATAPSALTAGSTATSVISISSTTAQAMSVTQRAQLERRFTVGSGVFFAIFLFIPSLRRRRAFRSLATLALLVCGLAVISGCSSSGTPTPKSSAGSYTVTVTGAGTTSGSSTAVTATTTFSLTIN